MDSSASVSHYEFSRVREFLGQLVAPLPLGPGALQASLVHVGSRPHSEFRFAQHGSGAAVQDAIRAAAQRMGDTNTGLALAYAKEELFAEAAGARLGVPKVLVWVTDGDSSDPVGPPMQELKDLGVVVFIVSTGRGNLLALSAAASPPPEEHLHFVDVDDLPIITQGLRASILGRWGWPREGPGLLARAPPPRVQREGTHGLSGHAPATSMCPAPWRGRQSEFPAGAPCEGLRRGEGRDVSAPCRQQHGPLVWEQR